MRSKLVSFPAVGPVARIAAKLLRRAGLVVVDPPPVTERTVRLGAELAPEMICHPYRVTLGSLREALALGANVLLQWDAGANTRCRQEQFWRMQAFQLRRAGYRFEMHGVNARNIVAVVARLSGRPRRRVVAEIRRFLAEVAIESPPWPSDGLRVGLIGEVYCLSDDAVTRGMQRTLEDCGAKLCQTADVHRFLQGELRPWWRRLDRHERQARAYFGGEFAGHASANVANLLRLIEHGVDGVVHVLPLTCMPEVTAEPVIDAICEDHELPLLRMAIDEAESEANQRTRLETFVEFLRLRQQQGRPTGSDPEGYFLGVDCGSVAVKAAVVRLDGGRLTVIREAYLPNKGVVETLQRCVALVGKDLPPGRIRAAGVTGSGRQLVSSLIGADAVCSEVVAHAVAALRLRPDVATVCDIGGQDCKLISLRDGVPTDFRMNRICGAGTGATLDAIAKGLGVATEDVGRAALSCAAVDFPGKCGIFAQSKAVHCLNTGHPGGAILAGVVEASVRNFLLMGRGLKLKPPYVFQGGLARNAAVVDALERQLGHRVHVPGRPHLMGAVGAAIIAARAMGNGRTRFRGWDVVADLRATRVVADGCENRCEITVFRDRGGAGVGIAGNKCDRCAARMLGGATGRSGQKTFR